MQERKPHSKRSIPLHFFLMKNSALKLLVVWLSHSSLSRARAATVSYPDNVGSKAVIEDCEFEEDASTSVGSNATLESCTFKSDVTAFSSSVLRNCVFEQRADVGSSASVVDSEFKGIATLRSSSVLRNCVFEQSADVGSSAYVVDSEFKGTSTIRSSAEVTGITVQGSSSVGSSCVAQRITVVGPLAMASNSRVYPPANEAWIFRGGLEMASSVHFDDVSEEQLNAYSFQPTEGVYSREFPHAIVLRSDGYIEGTQIPSGSTPTTAPTTTPPTRAPTTLVIRTPAPSVSLAPSTSFTKAPEEAQSTEAPEEMERTEAPEEMERTEAPEEMERTEAPEETDTTSDSEEATPAPQTLAPTAEEKVPATTTQSPLPFDEAEASPRIPLELTHITCTDFLEGFGFGDLQRCLGILDIGTYRNRTVHGEAFGDSSEDGAPCARIVGAVQDDCVLEVIAVFTEGSYGPIFFDDITESRMTSTVYSNTGVPLCDLAYSVVDPSSQLRRVLCSPLATPSTTDFLDSDEGTSVTLEPTPGPVPSTPAPSDTSAPVTLEPTPGPVPSTPAPTDTLEPTPGPVPSTPAPTDTSAPVTLEPGPVPSTPAPSDTSAPVTLEPTPGPVPSTPAPTDTPAPVTLEPTPGPVPSTPTVFITAVNDSCGAALNQRSGQCLSEIRLNLRVNRTIEGVGYGINGSCAVLTGEVTQECEVDMSVQSIDGTNFNVSFSRIGATNLIYTYYLDCFLLYKTVDADSDLKNVLCPDSDTRNTQEESAAVKTTNVSVIGSSIVMLVGIVALLLV